MAKNVSNEEMPFPYFSTKRKVTYWFNILNQEIFKSSLPKFQKVSIIEDFHYFAESEGLYDKTDRPVVDLLIKDKFKDIKQFISILAHEMIHLWQWIEHGSLNHSKKTFFDPWKTVFLKHDIQLKQTY